jgi:hypothetical protein
LKKNGFQIDEQCQLGEGYIKMATVSALNDNLFYKPKLNNLERESYKAKFNATLKRLERLGFIELASN